MMRQIAPRASVNRGSRPQDIFNTDTGVEKTVFHLPAVPDIADHDHVVEVNRNLRPLGEKGAHTHPDARERNIENLGGQDLRFDSNARGDAVARDSRFVALFRASGLLGRTDGNRPLPCFSCYTLRRGHTSTIPETARIVQTDDG